MIKKFIATILVFICVLGYINAQDSTDQWWLNKPIYSIKFDGLKHVEESTLKEITNTYLGKPYSNDLFAALQGEFFSLQYFAYFSAQAEKGGDTGEDLVIIFSFVELPVIASLEITGNQALRSNDLEEVLPLGIDSFATSAKIKEAESAIRELYLSKGFTSVTVVSDMVTDSEENTIDLTIKIQEGLQSKISTIGFEGNIQFSDSTLRRELVSRQQSLFNQGNYIESNIEKDKQALVNYYRERGFVDAAVTDVIVSEIEQDDSSKTMIDITFVIEEGDEWIFNGFEIEGNTIFTEEDIQKVITHRIGKPLNVIKIQQNISDIAKLYWNDGYVASKIDTEESRDTENNLITYNLTINEGNQSVIEDIKITGFNRTKDFVLYRELEIQPGDIFSIDDLFSSMRNIYNTGIIDDVTYEILYGSEEDSVVIELAVVEGNKVDLEFGAQFGGDDEFPLTGFFSWTDKNFAGNGQDFSIGLNISQASQTLDFSFEESWLMNQRWSGGISFSAGHYNQSNVRQDISGIIFSEEDYMDGLAAPDPYNSYEEYQAALSAGSSVPESTLMEYEQYKLSLGISSGYTFFTDVGRLSLGGNTSFALSYVYYDDSIYRPYNPIVRNNLDTWQFTNKVGFNFAWDGRDLIENTTTGFLLQESISYAGGFLGGVSNYIKNSTSLSGYATLFEIQDEDNPVKGVLSAKTSLSNIFPQYYNNAGTWEWGTGATQAEKLYIDGMNIARGSNTIYNLEFLWDNMLEFSMPISENVLWGEIYASATGYTSNLEDVPQLGIDDFYFSTGAGIRLAISGFPLGLYLTKNFYFDASGDFHWEAGDILADPAQPESGLKLVLAITTSLF